MKTEFVNKFVAAVGLLLLAMCIIAPNVSAADYSAAESVVEDMLLDPEYSLPIESVDVSISTEQVVFDCITDITVQEKGAPLGQVSVFVGGALGAYYQIVNSAPNVGDLVIIFKNRNEPTAVTMTCPKSWINSVDLTNADDANGLIYKVIETWE